ncbi:hypothetical protein JVT61DRAFT_14678 [Boletus reticuloceps]|uniref:Uncharacterized protein n=1 Tax=Boletus reticuloceps TaxID=495285 RepID=A0A8I2YT60_9AGAM|nr:hypothetical protein JVT61DRAFT_14678 [Boletus reticuloceps]
MINKKLATKRQNAISDKLESLYVCCRVVSVSVVCHSLAGNLSSPKKEVALIGQPRQSISSILSRRAGRPRNRDELSKPEACTPEFRSESQLKDTLKVIIGGSLRERMKALYKRFLSSGNYGEIYNTLSAVEPIEKEIRSLAFAEGDGMDLESSLFKTIRTVVKVLEDLLLNAMEGTDVSELERKGLLLYQVVPDVVLQ